MCHGAQDMVLPLTLGETARDQLQTAGYNIEWQEYPMGHEVCMPEIGTFEVDMGHFGAREVRSHEPHRAGGEIDQHV